MCFIGAADTFRAAANEQLESGHSVRCVTTHFKTIPWLRPCGRRLRYIESAQARNADVVMMIPLVDCTPK